jgi:hypothetical protein
VRRECTGLQLDERTGHLAPFRVRRGDDRSQKHGGMPVQDGFDLKTGDVLSARDDDVLRPVLDLDIAVRMPNGEIAGVELAAAKAVSVAAASLR